MHMQQKLTYREKREERQKRKRIKAHCKEENKR